MPVPKEVKMNNEEIKLSKTQKKKRDKLYIVWELINKIGITEGSVLKDTLKYKNNTNGNYLVYDTKDRLIITFRREYIDRLYKEKLDKLGDDK